MLRDVSVPPLLLLYNSPVNMQCGIDGFLYSLSRVQRYGSTSLKFPPILLYARLINMSKLYAIFLVFLLCKTCLMVIALMC